MPVDYTVKIFDQFYNLNLVVGADEYELVLSFFKEYTSNTVAAKSFTDSLFKISNLTQISPLELLKDFQNDQNQMAITLKMAYYLNSVSNKTVLYGVNNLVAPNNTVARNVIQ